MSLKRGNSDAKQAEEQQLQPRSERLAGILDEFRSQLRQPLAVARMARAEEDDILGFSRDGV